MHLEIIFPSRVVVYNYGKKYMNKLYLSQRFCTVTVIAFCSFLATSKRGYCAHMNYGTVNLDCGKLKLMRQYINAVTVLVSNVVRR